MRVRVLFILICTSILISCSKNGNFSSEFISQTSGRYLFNQDDIMEVYYEEGKMYLKWRNVEKLEPVVLDNNVIFLSEIYKKLHFVEHPETRKRYLSEVPEDGSTLTYDYLKVDDNYKTPSMYLKEKDFAKAAEGYLAIRAQDSSSELFDEYDFNRQGYGYLRDKDYESAIGIFEMNAKLFPESDNVYDSLAEAYLRSGDSVKAYEHYAKALSIDVHNKRAEQYLKAYDEGRSVD